MTAWGTETPIVIRRITNYYTVLWEGLELLCLPRARLKKEQVSIRVGDRVVLDEVDRVNRTAAIAQVLPRDNELTRPPIANVDQAVLVFAADRPAFDPMMVDRFLVLVAQSGISPVLAVNKADLVDPEGLAEQVGPYQAIGFPVVTTSARDGDVADLVGLLEQRVTVFAGPSGVGKSSLLNAVHPGLELKALDVSEKIQRGRHTTTFASLYPLELSSGLALVADTPGYSHLDFGPLAPDQLGWLFPEMAPHIPDCRFQDCLHRSEPGCAVKERAELSESRYASYLRFLDELEAKAARLSSTSLKDEGTVKSKAIAGGGETKLIKLGVAARSASRRLVRQQLATDLHEDEGEIEDDLDETEE